jgi:hypothetical protein
VCVHPQVLVGGLPCDVDVTSITATTLSCRAPSIAGQLLAEFWQMPVGTRVIPEDFGAYTRPGEASNCILARRNRLYSTCAMLLRSELCKLYNLAIAASLQLSCGFLSCNLLLQHAKQHVLPTAGSCICYLTRAMSPCDWPYLALLHPPQMLACSCSSRMSTGALKHLPALPRLTSFLGG